MAKRTRKQTAHCPYCEGWKTETTAKDGHMTSFTVAGVWHTAPDMWLAGRSRTAGSVEQAMRDWAFGCECQAMIEAQRKAVA